MNLNEWLSNKESLFQAVMQRTDVDLLTVDNIEHYNFLLKHMYGNLPVFRKVEDYTLNEVAELIATVCNDKWTKQYNLLYNEVVDGVASESTTTSTDTDSRTRQTDRNSENNVSAFNDTDYSPDDETVELTTEQDDNTSTRERTDTKKSLWAVQEQLRMREQNFIQDVIMKDIKSLIISKIY